MTIYIIVKIWNGGKIELIEAYKNEKEARLYAASQIPLKYDNYTIAIFTTKLMD